MTDKQELSRRMMLTGSAAAAAGVVFATGSQANADGKKIRKEMKMTKVPKLTNADFYDAAGKFDADKARQAYYDMFARFHYPNPKPQQDLMWVADFGLGDFINVGMAGVFWYNNKEHNFFGHEIYLLPGQQIPEHKHIAMGDVQAKMEAWQVRHGSVHCMSTDPSDDPLPVKLPASQEKIRTVKSGKKVLPGELCELNKLEEFHFMIAGPEGAIVTEYATYHTMDALRFANPAAKV